jgi:hypothetical protein
MKKILILLLVLNITGCNSQVKEPKQAAKDKKDTTIVKPKETWDVKKEYDEFGNLIKYDSIYSYSYSNIEGDSINVNLDSIMNSFKSYFDKNTPFKWQHDFSYFPQNDSMFMNDFFKDDYFFSQWNKQSIDIPKMMRQMDSTRNLFLKRLYPGLLESNGKTKL